MLQRLSIDKLDSTPIEFLWYPFIPYGVPTVFQGQAGYGKTTIIFRVMAELSHGIFPPRLIRGRIKDRNELTEWETYAIECFLRAEEENVTNENTSNIVLHHGAEVVGIDDEVLEESEKTAPALDLPFMRPLGDPVKMVYLSRENPNPVIRKKYESFGGDPRYLEIINEKEDIFVAKKDKIRELVGDAGFVVIDPIYSFVDGTLTNNEDVAKMMHDFEEVAHETGSAILLLNNLTKRGASDYNSGLGASNLKNIARSLFKLDMKSNFLYLASVKNNLAAANGKIAVLMDDLGRPGFMNYDRLQTILSSLRGAAPDTKLTEAIEFMKNLLADGPVSSDKVFAAADEAGISKTTLNRAKKEAGVESQRTNGNNSVWKL